MAGWLVADAGASLPGRKVLTHPSAVVQTPRAREAGYERQDVQVRLTMAQVKRSPDISTDAPVTRQTGMGLYGYHGWNPVWGGDGYFCSRANVSRRRQTYQLRCGSIATGCHAAATAHAGPACNDIPKLRLEQVL